MPDRAGYTLSLYAIDVSPSMGEEVDDPGTGSGKERRKTKLDLAKEFVARKCEPKILSGRKTEAVGILSFGGKTNNQAFQAYIKANPDEEDPPYAAVACDVAIQTAKPKTVEEVLNLDVGEVEGNPVSALMVGLDMIHTHKHTKSWALEVVLITDGESAFLQDEYENAMQRFDDLGVKLSVLGIDFQQPELPVEKTKSRNKRLAEKFWRTFIGVLHERISQTTSSEEILPTIGVFGDALTTARLPRPAVTNGTVFPINLYIASPDIDPEQAITIPIKYSKATMKARPPSLSKAWKPAMDLQGPQRKNGFPSQMQGASSQLASSLAQQSQAYDQPPSTSDLAAMISADVKHHSTYVIKKAEPVKPSQASQSQVDFGDEGLDPDFLATVAEEDENGDDNEEFVAKEDIVKAWRFGSTWVPMEADTFEPLNTTKGVEILSFFPRDAIRRHLLMGEVRFIWPDVTSPKAQIQFSSLVEGMYLRNMAAVVRWVLKDNAEPVIGLCVPEFNYPGEEKRLDYMFWVKLPFAEDEHNFWFPSLTTYKTNTGKVLTEHPLLPTEKQCELMDELVSGLDLDAYAKRQAQVEKEAVGDDEEEDGEEESDEPTPWFTSAHAYNPVIHRIKEAIFHASLTQDLDANPLGPPHPELVRFFNTPDELLKQTDDVTKRLKEELQIKKVPARVTRKKVTKEGLREDEGYINDDELFDDAQEPESSKPGPQTPCKSLKVERPESGRKGQSSESDEDMLPPITKSQTQSTPSKPKKGRLISNERPLEDFNRLVEGEGDVFRKAIQDLGAVVKENVESSFSRQAFPLALECLKAMRSTALTYEEVETYNEFIDDLKTFVTAPKFKHKDFWKVFEEAGHDVATITPEEAQEALDGYED